MYIVVYDNLHEDLKDVNCTFIDGGTTGFGKLVPVEDYKNLIMKYKSRIRYSASLPELDKIAAEIYREVMFLEQQKEAILKKLGE